MIRRNKCLKMLMGVCILLLSGKMVFSQVKDSLDEKTLKIIEANLNNLNRGDEVTDSLRMSNATSLPFVSLPEFLKGNIPGSYIQENSGEPGTYQSVIIRGLSSPLFGAKDFNSVQPVVFLNGTPMITENNLSFDIQTYDYNRLGPNTNFLTGINMDNVASVEVIKDPTDLAKLGPLAANGAIKITTKNAKAGYRRIELNSYFGAAMPERVETTNAAYINDFRNPFYEHFGSVNNRLEYPGYLSNLSDSTYFGHSDWTDLYYRTGLLYNANLALSAGSNRANFRFFAGHTRNAGNADNTGFTRENIAFYINMAPFEWLTLYSSVSASRMNRERNRNLRDRFAQTQYLPALSTPLSPEKTRYQSYLDEYNRSIDFNLNNLVQGNIELRFTFDRLKYISRFGFDYAESGRDIFFPSTLMGGNNFTSNYFTYGQRIMLSNFATYNLFKLKSIHQLSVEAGSVILSDISRYNYLRGYKGPSDFIKVNSGSGYQSYRFTDKERMALISFYGQLRYSFNNLVEVNALIRRDGTGNIPQDERWINSPALSATLNLKDLFLSDNSKMNDFSLTLSAAKLAQIVPTDRFSAGPQYTVDLGWTQAPVMGSYNQLPVLSRPYTYGWVGYGIKWPYTNQAAASLQGGLLDNRLNFLLTGYYKSNNRQIIEVPVAHEYGYTGQYLNGMDVRNTGVEITLGADILKRRNGLNWYTNLNYTYNENKLTSLPDDLENLKMSDRLLKVGQSVDGYWLLQNKGSFNNDQPQTTMGGVTFKEGDPYWADQNEDHIIDEDDKILMGHSTPPVFGGWLNTFKYKKFDLSFNLIYAIGHKAINRRAANFFDFINADNSGDLNSLGEIFFWQKDVDINKYPIYNPWSLVIPYRIDQDLFLENASYAKLRSVTLGYDFSKSKKTGKKRSLVASGVSRIYGYITITNVFTITKFSGKDPEMIDFTGYYTGYGMPIPRTVITGIKVTL